MQELRSSFLQHSNEPNTTHVLTDFDSRRITTGDRNVSLSVEKTAEPGEINHIINDCVSVSRTAPCSPPPPIRHNAVRRIFHKYLPGENWPLDIRDASPQDASSSDLSDSPPSDDLPASYHVWAGKGNTAPQQREKRFPDVEANHGKLWRNSGMMSEKVSSSELNHQPLETFASLLRTQLPSEHAASISMANISSPSDSDHLASYTSESFVLGSGSTLGNIDADINLFSSKSFPQISSGSPVMENTRNGTISSTPQASHLGGLLDSKTNPVSGSNDLIEKEGLLKSISESTDSFSREHQEQGSSNKNIMFGRTATIPSRSHQSLLRKYLKESDESVDVIQLARYARIGRIEPESKFCVDLYYLNQTNTKSNELVGPVQMCVQHTASMEELIGFGLYTYIKKHGHRPIHPLYESQSNYVLEPRAWVLRMVEGGFVDEDYPGMSS